MRRIATACALAVLSLACVQTPAAAQCRPANSKDAIYTGAGLPPQVAPRSTPAQNDSRSAFVGLLDPNRDTYDPGKANYGARYGENYGGAPGSTNEQASTFLGAPCGPPLTIAPVTPPVTLTPPPLIVAPPGTVDVHGLPVQPGTVVPGTPFPVPSIPAPQTLTVAPWNPAETNNALR